MLKILNKYNVLYSLYYIVHLNFSLFMTVHGPGPEILNAPQRHDFYPKYALEYTIGIGKR